MNPTLGYPRPALPARKHPIKIVCVLRDLAEQEATVKSLRDFCHTRNVMFECRTYDSFKHRHDRDEIVRLPAFHAYVNSRYERTFYTVGRPFQHVEEMITLYLQQKEERQRRRNRFRQMIVAFVARLKALTARAPTRLELEERRRQAEEFAEVERRRSFAERGRSTSMIDWD